MESVKHTEESEILTYAMGSVSERLKAYRLRFRREVLQKMLDAIDPNDEREQDEEDGIVPASFGLTLDKAQGAAVPIVRWLLSRSAGEKLLVVISHTLLCDEMELQSNGFYRGEIGNDLLQGWEKEIDEMSPDDLPDDLRSVLLLTQGLRAATA